jgi:hypothetical protein
MSSDARADALVTTTLFGSTDVGTFVAAHASVDGPAPSDVVEAKVDALSALKRHNAMVRESLHRSELLELAAFVAQADARAWRDQRRLKAQRAQAAAFVAHVDALVDAQRLPLARLCRKALRARPSAESPVPDALDAAIGEQLEERDALLASLEHARALAMEHDM